jgi:hypothetical protein
MAIILCLFSLIVNTDVLPTVFHVQIVIHAHNVKLVIHCFQIAETEFSVFYAYLHVVHAQPISLGCVYLAELGFTY